MAADTSGQENISENEFESQVNSNIRQILSTRDFSLNIDRTLRRKINGCRQVQVEYECYREDMGDGICCNVVSFLSVSYGLKSEGTNA